MCFFKHRLFLLLGTSLVVMLFIAKCGSAWAQPAAVVTNELDSFAYKLPAEAARNPEKLLEAAAFLLRKYEKNERASLIAKNLTGLYLSNTGHPDSAKKLYTEVSKKLVATGDKRYLAHTYNYLGILYYRAGALLEASSYFNKSISLFAAIGKKVEGFSAYNNHAGIYHRTGNSDKALAVMRELLQEPGLTPGQRGTVLLNMSHAMVERSRDSAYLFGLQALEAFKQAAENRGAANAQLALGALALLEDDPVKALYHYNNANDVYQKRNIQIYKWDVLAGRLQAFLLLRQRDSAAALLHAIDTSYPSGRNLTGTQQSQLCQLRGSYLMLTGQHEAGAKLLERAISLRDSIYKADNVAQLLELETIYQTERKNAEILQLKTWNKNHRQITLLTLLCSGTALLALLGLFMYRREKQRKEQILLQREQERIEQVLRKKELEEMLLKEKLEQAGKQLVNQSLVSSEHNKFLEGLLQFANETAGNRTMADSQKWQLLQNRLSRKLSGDSEWAQFLQTFELVNDQFFTNLSSKHPGLTLNEKRLCALSKIRMSNKEMAGILHISPDSVKMARYRLKKKMNIPQELDLDEYISSI